MDERVKMLDGAVPLELAMKCRALAHSVSASSIKPMDNIDNKPTRNIFNNYDRYIAPSDTPKWMWREYYEGTSRLFPRDLATLRSSPLAELIFYIDERFRAMFGQTIEPELWAVQFMAKDSYNGWHFDEMGTRKIAFLYYLTPNNWDYEKDGGGLVVQRKDSEELFTIQPAFNRLVMWTMVNHAVEKVRRGKGRVALVGFYRRRGDYP